VKNPVSKFAFKSVNLYRYTEEMETVKVKNMKHEAGLYTLESS
jgi:hypothetical protein